jgi:hypothetical protein
MKNKTIKILTKIKSNIRGKTKSKSRGKTKSKNKSKAQKGGLFNMSFGLNGKNLIGKTYGKKIYDHNEGKWKEQPCTKIFGLEYCETAKN